MYYLLLSGATFVYLFAIHWHLAFLPGAGIWELVVLVLFFSFLIGVTVLSFVWAWVQVLYIG